MLKAFLDTNILMGELSTCIFLANAELPDRLFHPRWNSHVFRELSHHLHEHIDAKDKAAGIEAARRRMRMMRKAFPESMVMEWETEMPRSTCFVNDPDDAQILAGAIKGGTDALVTNNVKDFDVDGIEREFGIIVEKGDDFLIDLLNDEPITLRDNLIRMASGFSTPPTNLRELCEIMSQTPEFARFGHALENRIKRQYDANVAMMFHRTGSGVQPRDCLGRFGRKTYPVSFDVLPPGTGYWGPDGNGPEF